MDKNEMIQILNAIANKADPDTGEEIIGLSDRVQTAIYKALFELSNNHEEDQVKNKPKKTRSSGLKLNNNEKELFNKLREFRSNKSKETGWKAYWFGANRALEEMSHYKPESIEDLQEIHGVGIKIIEECGRDYLSIIKEHVENPDTNKPNVKKPCKDCHEEIESSRVSNNAIRCISCQDKYEKNNPDTVSRKIDEPFGTREDFKSMSNKQFGTNTQNKI